MDLLRTGGITDHAGRPRRRVPAAPCRPAADRSGRTAFHQPSRCGPERGERPGADSRAPRFGPGTPQRHSQWTERRDRQRQRRRPALLHGEPHQGNLLNTRRGPLFVDLATCCRGPVEFDLAHAPEEVGMHYAGADHDLIHRCRALNWAMFCAWRWRRNDQMPDRDHWRVEGLHQVRAALDRCGPNWS
ncbi:phosphotransferase [Streptomyces sp. GKU 257-1]|nr:phosphotransferase [Streptomyces sp. GKU 257-1]